MKKISFLLVLLIFLFTNFLPVHAKKISTIDLENLHVFISGSNTSIIELSFETDEPIFNLEIWINYSKNDSLTKDLIYGERKEQSERCQIISRGQIQENGMYLYSFVFTATEKISTFDFVFTYEVDGNIISQKVYVTNGNPNVDDKIFTPVNAVIIGIIVTIAASIATFLIIKVSEKNVQISDDEE